MTPTSDADKTAENPEKWVDQLWVSFLVVTDSNHFVAAYSANRLIGETLDWQDWYLGLAE